MAWPLWNCSSLISLVRLVQVRCFTLSTACLSLLYVMDPCFACVSIAEAETDCDRCELMNYNNRKVTEWKRNIVGENKYIDAVSVRVCEYVCILRN